MINGNHIKKRQMEFFMHVMRNEGLESLAVTGLVKGSSIGKQIHKFIVDLREESKVHNIRRT